MLETDDSISCQHATGVKADPCQAGNVLPDERGVISYQDQTFERQIPRNQRLDPVHAFPIHSPRIHVRIEEGN